MALRLYSAPGRPCAVGSRTYARVESLDTADPGRLETAPPYERRALKLKCTPWGDAFVAEWQRFYTVIQLVQAG